MYWQTQDPHQILAFILVNSITFAAKLPVVKCDMDGFIAFTHKAEIETEYVFGHRPRTLKNFPHQGIPEHLAFDYNRKIIFYSVKNFHAINSVFFNNTNHTIIASNQFNVSAMFFDALHDQLYWTKREEVSFYRINPYNPHDGVSKALTINDTISIDGFTMDIFESRLYWTHLSEDHLPSIRRSSLCGTGIEMVVNTNITSPWGLTLDHPSRKLYWADQISGVLEQSDYDGKNRKVIFKDRSLVAFAVISEFVYWGDKVRKYTNKYNMDLGHDSHIGHNKDVRSMIAVSSQLEASVSSPDEFKTGVFDYWQALYNERLTVCYSDKIMALYIDRAVPNAINWTIPLLSKSWRYVRKAYQLSATDPRLHIILRGKPTDCERPSISHKRFRSRFVMDCTSTDSNGGWASNSTANFQTLLTNMAALVRLQAEGVEINADYSICGHAINHLILYDLYLNSIGGHTLEIQSWKRAKEVETWRGKPQCFKKWFLPIYERNNNDSAVIHNYFKITKLYWLKRTYASTANFNLGEFIHFWSRAACAHLNHLSKNAFNWTLNNTNELEEAGRLFQLDFQGQSSKKVHYSPQKTNITWTGSQSQCSTLTLAYEDPNIAVYLASTDFYRWTLFVTISDVWSYCKENLLGLQGNHSPLNIVLRSNKTGPEPEEGGCRITRETIALKNVIECEASDLDKCYTDMPVEWDDIFEKIARMVLITSTEGVDVDGNWPAWNVSGWFMESILLYDIYLGLGMTMKAESWAAKELEGTSAYTKYWFRDWYLQIYKRFGGTDVLRGFFTILRSNLLSTNGTTGQLNMGEYVHFWSGATNSNLRELAKLSLDWDASRDEEFIQARVAWPGLNYTCERCDEHTQNPDVNTGQSEVVVPVVAGVSVAIVAVALIAFGIKMRADSRKLLILSQELRKLTAEEIDEFYNGSKTADGDGDFTPIHSLPFNMEYEVPRERFFIDDNAVLGSGEFGIVKKGMLKGGEDQGTPDSVVAIKTTKLNVEVSYFKAMLLEIKIMARLEEHPNIVSLMGTVTANIGNREVFAALEFCAKGDLLHHLKANCGNFKNMFSSEIEKNSDCVYNVELNEELNPHKESNTLTTTRNLVDWSQQIANGMIYLSSKNVIHGDLAARNILLTEDFVAKISDFGLSRQLINFENYSKKTATPLPWRWLAIESLTEMNFSVQSDVWSFGVTLWEIFTLGKVPYAGRTCNDEFIEELKDGLRLKAPEFGNQEISDLMLDCMRKEPAERISFPQIQKVLASINRSNMTNSDPSYSRECENYV